jgi:divalent metal cation (Fe/Co/Zn/Cd) transporter
MKKAFNPLLDEAWQADEVEELERNLNEMNVNYHQLRTRIAGNYRFLDLHIELPKDLSVESAHTYCDKIEEILITKFENLNVTIHVEPS